MKQFMDKDFLLDTATAKHLFHDYAEHMPIIDYHCHISPQEIAEDHHFRSITEVWLGGDHYKWRLIRSNGTPEEKVTGTESTDWKNSLNMRKLFHELLAIRSIIGAIWNCSAISVLPNR